MTKKNDHTTVEWLTEEAPDMRRDLEPALAAFALIANLSSQTMPNDAVWASLTVAIGSKLGLDLNTPQGLAAASVIAELQVRLNARGPICPDPTACRMGDTLSEEEHRTVHVVRAAKAAREIMRGHD